MDANDNIHYSAGNLEHGGCLNRKEVQKLWDVYTYIYDYIYVYIHIYTTDHFAV